MKKTIVKIQRPIVSTEGANDLMIYDKTRSIMTSYMATDEEMEALFPNDEYKTYWLVEIDHKTKQFYAVKQMPEQNW